ncbi:MAG: GGDEF domain-containing protein [Chloroflexota bacterium]|nr:GGDEF domain-containing protein [Chloroflexota bacterium]
MASEVGGRPDAEIAGAAIAYRRRVRRASVLIVASLVTALSITAFLPTTPGADRVGLLVGAGTVGASALIWFFLVPRELFAGHRIFVAAVLAQASLLVVIALSGGIAGTQFAYYLLPVLVQIFGGKIRETVALGAIAALGIVGLAITQDNGGPARTFSLAVIRLLELGTITAFASIAAATTGATRRELTSRTGTLAGETEANFQLAVTDTLTGLYNRRFMSDVLGRLVARSERNGRPLSVIALDVDGLKVVNDSRGHAAGDALLRAAGDAIREGLRSEDLGVRAGGDEFIAVLAEAGEAEAQLVAARIRSSFTQRKGDTGAGLSCGIAVWTPGTSVEALLGAADASLYDAKLGRR